MSHDFEPTEAEKEMLSHIKDIEVNRKQTELDDIISGAILDGQNQIHDLYKEKSTAQEVEYRMRRSYTYWMNKLHQELQKAREERDTYWKERVRKEVEGMKKDFVPADLIWEGDEEQEVGEWKYVPKEDGMYCLNCERFVPEEGCICGLISFEALDTLLDNLK